MDGYCCEEGDKHRAVSDKPVNYTTIAIKGLLYKFKRRSNKAYNIFDNNGNYINYVIFYRNFYFNRNFKKYNKIFLKKSKNVFTI